MFENQFHISLLMARQLRGELTVEEQEQLEMWLNENENNRNWASKITREENLPALLKDYYAADETVVWNKLNSKIQEDQLAKPIMRVRKLYKTYRIAVAAAILFVLGIGLYFYYSAGNREYKNRFADHDLAPGGNSATLTLSNGRKIKLSAGIKGELAQEADIRITKTKDGQVVYTILAAPGGTAPPVRNNGVIAYNTLSTAKGEMYQIVLPDKSVVWLNATSSLKYPASFANLKERKVILDGEGYFEVMHNAKQPFRVQTTNQLVEDVGTAFNVNAYLDEPDSKTTLVEGSVAISLLAGGTLKQSAPQVLANVILKPGQQGITAGGTIIVKNADLAQTVAWKNGDFIFKNDDFKTIMRQLARWYKVEVIYDASAPDNVQLGGYVSRSKNISSVLKIMEITGKVHFKLEGRRVIVTK